MHDLQGFENFRRERNKRRMEDGPLRPMGQNAAILREIEEADAREARNQRLTREVHEFFAEATRTAATIVSQVAENAEQELQASVAHEMSEFLAETIRRAQILVESVQVDAAPGVAQQDVEANMQNIVGRALDEFRFAGDAATAEAHVGQDPFATDLDVGPDSGSDEDLEFSPQGPHPIDALPSEPSSIEDHLVAEVVGDEQDEEVHEDGYDPLWAWLERITQDEDSLRTALKALVRVDVMTKSEARAIYRAR